MRLRFILTAAGKGVWRNMAMTVSVIVVTFVSLLFVGSGALAQMQVAKMKDQWYDKVEVTVFFCTESDAAGNCNGVDATQAQIDAVRLALESPPLKSEVQKIYFETKEQAYSEFKHQMAGSALAQNISPQMMPASFRIKLVNPTHYAVIQKSVGQSAGVQSVLDQSRVIEPLFNVLNKASLVSLSLAGLMIVAAALLITVTIRISALSREKETSIMRLVGASNLFVRLPFMLEGACAALIGAVLASVTLWVGTHALTLWLAQSFPWIGFVGNRELVLVVPALIVGSVLLSSLASLVSLSRISKV